MSPLVALLLCFVAACSADAYYPYQYQYYPADNYNQYYDYYNFAPYSDYYLRFYRNAEGGDAKTYVEPLPVYKQLTTFPNPSIGRV